MLSHEHGGVVTLTLNRPDRRNAIDHDLAAALAARLEEADADRNVRAVVLTGAARTFCSGMDLDAWGHLPAAQSAAALGALVRTHGQVPRIAAIEGHAVGGGCELALACDIVVAARDARLGLPEVRHGLVPSGGGLLRLARAIPVAVAMDMALTGDLVDAERLHALGLVSRLAEPGAALDAARQVAARIAANGPGAVNAGRALVRRAHANGDLDGGWAHQDVVAARQNDSAEAAEGVRAFLERRPPDRPQA